MSELNQVNPQHGRIPIFFFEGGGLAKAGRPKKTFILRLAPILLFLQCLVNISD